MMSFVFSIRIRQHTVYQIDIIHFFSRILFALFYDPQDTERHIGGVMVSVLDSSAVDREFEPGLGQTDKIGICCFSAKHAALRRKSKD